MPQKLPAHKKENVLAISKIVTNLSGFDIEYPIYFSDFNMSLISVSNYLYYRWVPVFLRLWGYDFTNWSTLILNMSPGCLCLTCQLYSTIAGELEYFYVKGDMTLLIDQL